LGEKQALLIRVERERAARKEAESLLEKKSRELHTAVQESQRLNDQLEKTVVLQTRELLSAQRMTRLGTFVWDIGRNMISWTEAGGRVLGLEASDTKNTFEEFLAVIHPQDRREMQDLQAALCKYAENPGEISVDTEQTFRVVLAHGEIRWIKFVYELTDVMSVSGAVQDITESVLAGEKIREARMELEQKLSDLESTQKELEIANKKAQAASATKSRFIAMVSHEIRTPLNGLLGTLTLLADNQFVEDQEELLDVAISSAESLRVLVNDIIDFARLETGKIQLEFTDFDIRDLISQLIEFWKPSASSSGNSLDAKVKEAVPGVLRGDATRIGQVLNNLISNAIKFTQDGNITVDVGPAEAVEQLGGNYPLIIKVKDTGKGLTKDEQANLFKEFSQIPAREGDTKRVFDFSGSKTGAGLGLAISQTLVKQMGGAISVTSAPETGSTFSVQLTLETVSATNRKKESIEIKPLRTLGGGTPCVLVADDVPANQLVSRMLLQGFGCRVDIVNDGIEAVAACKERKYDFILMDVSMPRLDGIAATEQIRLLEQSENDKMPIIGLTAFAFTDEAENFVEAGMNKVISKPVRKETLYMAAKTALQGDFAQAGKTQSSDIDSALSLDVLKSLISGLSHAQILQVIEQTSIDLKNYRHEAIADAKAGNLLSLARSCHAIKGLAASFGSHDLAKLASQIEEYARYGDSELAFAVTLGKLDAATDVAVEAYQQFLQDPGALTHDS
jgi:signal transduction histidine kinase/DNA-binding response OmpR family regulator